MFSAGCHGNDVRRFWQNIIKNGIFHPSVVSKCGFLWHNCVIIKKAHTMFNENNDSWLSLRSCLVLSFVIKCGWGKQDRKDLILSIFIHILHKAAGTLTYRRDKQSWNRTLSLIICKDISGKLTSSTRNHVNNVGIIKNNKILQDMLKDWISTPKRCYKAFFTIKVVG